MNYTDSDIQAIVDTKTEQLKKEIELKDEEYNILKVTSEQYEEELKKEIYELNRTINKAKVFLENYLHNLNPDFKKEDWKADEDVGFAYEVLNNKE